MSKKIRYIVVDAGKNTVKFYELFTNGNIKYLGSFPARYKEGSSNVVSTDFEFDKTSNSDDEKNISRNETFQIVYNGEHYILGEKGEFYCNFKDKAQPIHRLCAYTAIANLVENGDDVHLIIGSTYNYVEGDTEKKEIKTYYKNTGDIKIRVNNVEKTFKIFDVSLYPEGLALILRMRNKKKAIQIGCDIGGKTSDVYDFSTGVSEYLTSDDKFGINRLYARLESKLTLFAKNIKPIEQDYIDIIQNKDNLRISLDDAQIKELDKIIDSFVDKIVNFVFRYYDDFDSSILFSGGSSVVLKSRLLKVLTKAGVPEGNILFANSPFDNVFSYGLSFLKEVSANDKTAYAQAGSNFMKKAKKLEKDYMDRELEALLV